MRQPALVTQRGSISMEAVIVIPAFLLFLALVVGVGRVSAVRGDLHAAAVNGARTASTQTTSVTGEQAGRKAIEAQLDREKVTCLHLDISLNTSALNLPPGQAGSVTATVTCVVPLADLAIPGLPGQTTIRSSFTTPIDTYSR